MKRSLPIAAAFAAVSVSVVARADDGAIVRAHFDSSATNTVVHVAACSFDASSTFDGRAHDFDVHVGGERCPNRALQDGAIPLFVRFEHGDEDRVVVEAAVPEGVDAQKLHTAVIEIATELERRVDRASQPAQPTTRPVTYYTPSAHARNDAWAREPSRDWYRPYKRASPGLMAGGILLVIAGSLATFGGTVSALSNTAYGNAAPGLLVLGGGIAGLASGIPMVVAGGKKVPNVSAGVSPAGGNLRVTF